MIYSLLTAILILDCVILAVVVLLQAGQGGGLAGLGGGASTESFLGGRQATTVLTKMSWWCGGIFLGLSVVLAGLGTGSAAATSVLQEIQVPTPVAVSPLPIDFTAPAGPGAAQQDSSD